MHRACLLVRPPGVAVFAAAALLSCGAGNSLSTPPIDSNSAALDPDAAAVRFLTRATFGPSPSEVDAVLDLGYEGWIDAQIDLEPTRLVPGLLELGCSPVLPGASVELCGDLIDPHIAERNRLWWEHTVYAPDQLRQRVGFALAEIFVVSHFNAVLAEYPVMLADYYDMLVDGAFGSYRELLEEVTLHPAMGIYLSMLGNRKADPVLNTRPDENYAREVMQLFSIGLVQLGPNGKPLTGGDGLPIPTYTQTDIEELARVFTGWTFATEEPKTGVLDDFLGQEPKIGRMQPWPAFHDDGSKLLLGDNFFPAGLTAEDDLGAALDLLAGHPNVGPFIGKQLIQRLVTSNPSDAYVTRVSAVFDDDGTGERGNLEAVVRAILLDPEAQGGTDVNPNFGKVREPVLRGTALWRALEALPPDIDDPVFWELFAPEDFGQAPFYSPSVFNYFSPFYATSDLAAQGLVGPELQISTHSGLTRVTNYLTTAIYDGNTVELAEEWTQPVLDLAPLMDVAGEPAELVDLIDLYLLGGVLGAGSRQALITAIEATPMQEGSATPPGYERAALALALVIASPDFHVQR